MTSNIYAMTLTQLTPLELNKYRFSGNHTPLTPEQIEQLHQASNPTQ